MEALFNPDYRPQAGVQNESERYHDEDDGDRDEEGDVDDEGTRRSSTQLVPLLPDSGIQA